VRCIFALAYSIVIEITKAGDPNKTVISLIEKNNIYGCYIKRAEIRMSTDKRVSIFVTLGSVLYILQSSGPMPLGFRHCHETGSASRYNQLGGGRIKSRHFTTCSGLAMSRFPSSPAVA